MSRLVSFILGPESVLLLISALVFWFCARHNSGVGRDVELLERLLMVLPFIVVPLAFGFGIVLAVALGIVGGIWSSFRR